MKVLFIDDRPSEIIALWQRSGLESTDTLLPVTPFVSLEKALQQIKDFNPDMIVIGYGLGHPELTGADVVNFLRKNAVKALLVGNSAGGLHQFEQSGVKLEKSIDRNPTNLKKLVQQ